MDNKVILLVEDNEDDIELTLMALEQGKVFNKIVIARDGQEALDYIFKTGKHSNRAENENPQLVLLDLKLPKVDGFEVLKKIKSDKNTKLLPVVILTSSKEDSDLVNGYNSGANSYIRKPVDFDQFTKSVEQLGLYWLVLNEPPPDR